MGRQMKKWGGVLLIFVLAVAAAPRKAKMAVPARPVGQAEGVLAGRVILVDPGHGGRDGGARARDTGTWEKEINLQTALALRDALEEAGARVILTRDADRQYSDNKREDLTARLRLARENGAEMVISIHMNEYRSRRESGPQVFYRAGREESRLLAGALQSSLIRTLAPKKERAAMAGDYFILSLDVPSVLVECGFLSNPEEEKLLLTASYRRRIAEALRDGIIEYFELTN
ncbi:MAG: N-acetylmuramoyl-L-alanine amidase [Clostridia bacterium]|nr:N-acetylmuramoyl-L-alanine amidase [Clostridia bacterium]